MKLSEQIANTCCGVLADKQEMIDKAKEIEEYIQYYKDIVEDLQRQLMEIGSE